MTKELKINGMRKKYTIDEYGNIYDVEAKKYRKQIEHRKGYMKVSFYINGKEKRFFVHRLVLMTFNPVEGMESLQVNHIDGNKKNNYIGNLEWCTQSENQKHAFQNDLISRKGSKNSQAKLTEEQVIEIANMLLDNISEKEIAKIFNVSPRTISMIRTKRNWSYILKDYEFPKSKYSNVK